MMSGSVFENMKHTSNVRSLTRSIMRLFVAKKRIITFERHPDEYYGNYWINKKISDGIELVASIENTTKKHAAEELIAAGLSKYMGAKITEWIQAERAAAERNEKAKRNRFIREVIRFARLKVMDLKKIF
ncbi:MAG: hypothetical protein A2Z29_01210 [Chloroflexi bacterium RBG_16_56_11]|nr:MAG: hypothetical protein A2Z29_01210 [Chloroflexi bacterium RBG_16_56_11]